MPKLNTLKKLTHVGREGIAMFLYSKQNSQSKQTEWESRATIMILNSLAKINVPLAKLIL